MKLTHNYILGSVVCISLLLHEESIATAVIDRVDIREESVYLGYAPITYDLELFTNVFQVTNHKVSHVPRTASNVYEVVEINSSTRTSPWTQAADYIGANINIEEDLIELFPMKPNYSGNTLSIIFDNITLDDPNAKLIAVERLPGGELLRTDRFDSAVLLSGSKIQIDYKSYTEELNLLSYKESASKDIFRVSSGIPAIQVKGNSNNIADLDITPSATDFTNFGEIQPDASDVNRTRAYVVNNTGTAPLIVSAISVTSQSGFDVVPLTLPLEIAPGASEAFEIRLMSGLDAGVYNATVTVSSDADVANPDHTFAIAAEQVRPLGEIEVAQVDTEGNPFGGNITSGDEIDLGNLTMGQANRLRLSISNIGVGALELGSGATNPLTIDENAHYGVTFSNNVTAEVAASQSRIFDLDITPNALGLVGDPDNPLVDVTKGISGTFILSNDDADEYNFVIRFKATVVIDRNADTDSDNITDGDEIYTFAALGLDPLVNDETKITDFRTRLALIAQLVAVGQTQSVNQTSFNDVVDIPAFKAALNKYVEDNSADLGLGNQALVPDGSGNFTLEITLNQSSNLKVWDRLNGYELIPGSWDGGNWINGKVKFAMPASPYKFYRIDELPLNPTE